MAPALDIEIIRGPVLDCVVSLVTDPIPNIRFNVAKALEVLATVVAGAPGGQELVTSAIAPALQRLREDSDADVRFFAEKALQTAEAIAAGQLAGTNDTPMQT